MIAEWDCNGQHNHRHKTLELSETSITSWENQWLEKHNKLTEFYNSHGHTQVTFSNCGDESLAHWVHAQRRCCKIENRIKLRSAIYFDWPASEALEA